LEGLFLLDKRMNDVELIEPAQRPDPKLACPPCPEEPIAAAITVYSRRETDESYEGVISCEGDLRIINCPDDIQWIVQRLSGGQGETSHSIGRVTL
jgi:hypothetical protein